MNFALPGPVRARPRLLPSHSIGAMLPRAARGGIGQRVSSRGKWVRDMKMTRLARTLGLDGNPLRRRTDKIEAWLAALTLVVFVTAAPVLSVAVGHAWVTGHSPTRPPLNHGAVLGREAVAAVVVPIALGWVLLCLAEVGRWVLDRRRLADWDAAWAAVGPQWTKRFG
jgi:hypothetical protein